jgi:2,4-dienoyl-CoA reductase-like NADH-dependent reductase (Old Yellow Enzyme family)
MQSGLKLADPLPLACGLVLENRLAKAAMTEQLAKDATPGERHRRLYQRFARGGVGLSITGNVMVHRDQREHPRNVVIDDQTPREALQAWAEDARGCPLVAQLSHPGRQALYAKPGPVSPSGIALQGLGPFFRPPRALAPEEIDEIVGRFANAARICEEAGFAGVQIHAAHGYLVSQFLSPLANQRTDGWGGSLENRARFLLEILRAVRAAVRPGFALLVKLNSADFQRGGFDEGDALAVMGMLAGLGVDLLEISGGSYEAPAMVGLKDSTRAREAYFLSFAERARSATAIPLMVTGGFRTPAAMEEAVASGAVDVVGLARPLALEPDLPRRILAGDGAAARTIPDKVGVRLLDGILATGIYVETMRRIADGAEQPAAPSRATTIARQVLSTLG